MRRTGPTGGQRLAGAEALRPRGTTPKLCRRFVPFSWRNAASVVLLGDGEFDGTGLQHTLAETGWSYVCRTGCHMTASWQGETFRLDTLWQGETFRLDTLVHIQGSYCAMAHGSTGPFSS